MSEPTFEDYVRAADRAKLSAAAAVSYAALSLPLSYQSYNNLHLARMHFEASRLHDEHIEREGHLRPFAEVQAARDYSSLCYRTAVKESALSAGYALAVILPLALLAKRFFKNIRLAKEFDNAKTFEVTARTSPGAVGLMQQFD